jgi:hypothetical protein
MSKKTSGKIFTNLLDIYKSKREKAKKERLRKARVKRIRQDRNRRMGKNSKSSPSAWWIVLFISTTTILFSILSLEDLLEFASPETKLNYFLSIYVPLGLILAVSLYKLYKANIPSKESQQYSDEFFYEDKLDISDVNGLGKTIIYYAKSPWRIIRNKTRKPAPKLTRLTDEYALSSDGELIEIDDEDQQEAK